jgi:hypothetical protein
MDFWYKFSGIVVIRDLTSALQRADLMLTGKRHRGVLKVLASISFTCNPVKDYI